MIGYLMYCQLAPHYSGLLRTPLDVLFCFRSLHVPFYEFVSLCAIFPAATPLLGHFTTDKMFPHLVKLQISDLLCRKFCEKQHKTGSATDGLISAAIILIFEALFSVQRLLDKSSFVAQKFR